MQPKKLRQARIQKMWDDRAKQFSTKHDASWGDHIIFLENKTIVQYLRDGARVLDAGCANGFCTFYFAKKRTITVEGIDYSKKMIEMARKRLARTKKGRSKISFHVGDILSTGYPDNYFDIVISKRTIINLPTTDLQKRALSEYRRILKRKGLLLLSEATIEGLHTVNRARSFFKLGKLAEPWHNHYLREKTLLPFLKKIFTLREVNDFSATYFFISRVLFPYFEKDASKITYNAPVNAIALSMPNLVRGNFGTQKLFVLEKK